MIPNMKKTTKHEAWLVYPEALTYSGQTAATEMILSGLSSRNWALHKVGLPQLERGSQKKTLAFYKYFSKLFKSLAILLLNVFRWKPVIHFNHGQSLASFVRMGLPHLLIAYLNRSASIVTSLHGSVFMSWRIDQIELKFFLLLLKKSKLITVLGENQKRRLIDLGIEESKILIVPNTCDFKTDKQQTTPSTRQPIKLLHLSLLIESKGYPEYLEALEILACKDSAHPIEAILCGPVSISSYCKKFSLITEAELWIENKINSINQKGTVHVKWIKGATGSAKQQLFSEADIFIFPSQFPVEAQPLVLVEAMASGCSIITSKVGEIPSTLGPSGAIYLTTVSPQNIADEVTKLIEMPELQNKLSKIGIERANTVYSKEQYISTWESIFKSLSTTT